MADAPTIVDMPYTPGQWTKPVPTTVRYRFRLPDDEWWIEPLRGEPEAPTAAPGGGGAEEDWGLVQLRIDEGGDEADATPEAEEWEE